MDSNKRIRGECLGSVGSMADLRDALADVTAERDAWERIARRRLAEIVELQRELDALRRSAEGGADVSHYEADYAPDSQDANM